MNNGQVLETQEVELDQTDQLHIFHGILGVDRTGFLVLVERQKLFQLIRGHHDCGGMGRGMAGQPFQAERGIQQVLDLWITGGQFPQLRFLLECLGQGHLQVVRDQLGDPVHIAVGQVQGAAHVAHHRLGSHGPKGDNLADPVAAVLFNHVLDHLAPAVLAEVHVDIRHGDSFRVEKTFEEEIVGEGVQVGDLCGVGHQRTGRRTPARADRNAAILGPADKVRYDQEIGRELHLPDTIQLDCQPIKIGLLLFQGHVGVLGQDGYHPFLESFSGQFLQHFVVIFSLGRVKVGEVIGLAVNRQIQVAAFGDRQGVADRFGCVAESLCHLLRRLDVELIDREFHMGRIAHGLAGLDAEQHFMGAGIFTVQVMAVVGSHQRQLQLGSHLQQAFIDDVLLRYGVFLQFDIVTLRKQLAVPAGGCHGVLHPAPAALHRHLALEAG